MRSFLLYGQLLDHLLTLSAFLLHFLQSCLEFQSFLLFFPFLNHLPFASCFLLLFCDKLKPFGLFGFFNFIDFFFFRLPLLHTFLVLNLFLVEGLLRLLLFEQSFLLSFENFPLPLVVLFLFCLFSQKDIIDRYAIKHNFLVHDEFIFWLVLGYFLLNRYFFVSYLQLSMLQCQEDMLMDWDYVLEGFL